MIKSVRIDNKEMQDKIDKHCKENTIKFSTYVKELIKKDLKLK
jgi:hypothetical protein